jgi:CBS-domain-containing membrane protein
MLLSNFKKNLLKGALIILGVLVLFLVQQFFWGFTGSVDLLLAAVIFFSLSKSPLAWPIAVFSGWLTDAFLGTGFFHVIQFLAVAVLIAYFIQTVALENYLARWLLIGGGFSVALLLGYFLVFISGKTGSDFYRFLISLSAADIIVYLAVNSLIVFLLMLVRQKLTPRSYARFS